MLIYAACFFGKTTGFMLGVLTALVSNLFLGHGAWTPYQMAAWGIIGYLSGFFRPLLFPKKNGEESFFAFRSYKTVINLAILSVWGAICGALFSLITDLNSVFFYYGKFTLARYLAVISVAFGAGYIITNVIFVLLFISRSFIFSPGSDKNAASACKANKRFLLVIVKKILYMS